MSRRNRILLLLVVLIAIDVAAFLAFPHTDPKDVSKCVYPVCFINGNLELPAPHAVLPPGHHSPPGLIVFDAVYDEFRERLILAAPDYETGPLISEASLDRILGMLDGVRVVTGGRRVDRPGWWLEPTVVEGVASDADLSCSELFGPVTILYRVRDLSEALALVNDSQYGLTSAIHTASLHRALRFAESVQAGVVVVNGGTAHAKLGLISIDSAVTYTYRTPKWIPWTATGVGAATLLGGIAFYYAGRSQMRRYESDFATACPTGVIADFSKVPKVKASAGSTTKFKIVEVARPPRNEAAVKMAMPAMKTRRRPRMSPARAPSSSRPPKVSV